MFTKIQKLKILTDILLTAALLFLMPYEMIGDGLHEWIGVGMFLLFILHHILNRRWTANLGRGRYTPFRIVQTILVVLILVCMFGSMVSGVLLSNYVFSFLDIRGLSAPARTAHMTCAYWGFVLMSLHLGIHWRGMMGMAGKIFPGSSRVRRRIVQTAGAAIAAYGLYAFIKSDIGSYMLMQVHFVFFDYSEPVVFFLFDYMAVMGMFVFIGHYFCKAIRNN